MTDYQHTIGLLFSNPADRQLLVHFLQEQGHQVWPPAGSPPEAWPELDLILLDAEAGRRYASAALAAKKRAKDVHLPVLVVVTAGQDPTHWLEAGFDDVLRLPITKAELRARLGAFLRLREHSLRAFRRSEERFQFLAKNSRDIVFRYRAAPPRGFDYISPSVATITGYTPEEFYADPDLGEKIVHPEDRAGHKQRLSGQADYSEPVTTRRWRCKDGRIIWTEQVSAPVFDENGGLLYLEGVARDITARKEAEEQLRRHAQRLAALNDLSRAILTGGPPHAIAEVALDSLRSLVHYQHGGIALFSLEDENGLILSSTFTAPDLQTNAPLPLAGADALIQRLAQGEVLRLKNLSAYAAQIPAVKWALDVGAEEMLVAPLRVEDRLVGALYIDVDETRRAQEPSDAAEVLQEAADLLAIGLHRAQLQEQIRRHAQELESLVAERTRALADSEARYRQIVESPLVGIWIADTQGRFVFVNQRLAQLAGYDSPDEIVGHMTMMDAVTPEDREWLLARMEQRRLGLLTADLVEVEMLHKDGSRFTALAAPAGLVDGEGRFAGYIGAMVDISERKRLEQELAERVAEQDRLLKLMVGREIRMAELKDAIRQLRQQLLDAGLRPVAGDPLMEDDGDGG